MDTVKPQPLQASDESCAYRPLIALLQRYLALAGVAGVNSDCGALPTLTPQDAEAIVAYAAAHRVLPLVHRVLTEQIDTVVPSSLRAAAWASYESNRVRNRASEAELARVVACIEAADILVVPYKGPTLARALYGDAALREYGDLDLLVPRDQVFVACDLLASLGYRPRAQIAVADRDAFLRAGRQYDVELFHQETRRLVELHWRSDAQHAMERLDDARSRDARPSIEMEGVRYRQLPDVELMFALLIHGAKHRWDHLAWLIDIALLASRMDDVAWQRLAGEAQSQRCEVRFLVGLFLVRDVLRVAIRLDALASARVRTRAQRLAAEIANEIALSQTQRPVRSVLQSILGDLRFNDTFKQSLAQATRIAFTPNHDDWGHHARDGGGVPPFLRRLAMLLQRRVARR
jgi:hypothetical protein